MIAAAAWNKKFYHPHFIHEEGETIQDFMLVFPTQETQLQAQYFIIYLF